MTRAAILLLSIACVAVPAVVAQDDPGEPALEAASGGRTVRIRLTNGAPRIVDVPIEVYVARVLAAEGEPRAPFAAQQALSVAIRTFTAANTGRHRRDGFDLCDSTHCQVLRASTPVTRRAAMSTVRQVLMYGGRPADVFYSASCGGRSEAASDVWRGAIDHPYLRAAADEVHEGEAPWTLEVPLQRVELALRRIGFEGRRLKDVRVEQRSESGRVARLHLSGLEPEEIAGDDFRAALGTRDLRSTQFDVTHDGDVLRFTGRGYGHGVGLCVIGAGLRAARGDSARQILEQYFPGVQLESPALAAAVVPPAPEVVTPPVMRPAQEMLVRVRAELAGALDIDPVPALQLHVHETLDSFRQATGRPWWVNSVVTGSTIELAPLPVLAQRDGFEAAMRRAVAEALVAPQLPDRPAWVRVGAALYYSKPPAVHLQSKRHCPTDAELTMAVSASAQRDAELRAEACFARAVARVDDWRSVR